MFFDAIVWFLYYVEVHDNWEVIGAYLTIRATAIVQKRFAFKFRDHIDAVAGKTR